MNCVLHIHNGKPTWAPPCCKRKIWTYCCSWVFVKEKGKPGSWRIVFSSWRSASWKTLILTVKNWQSRVMARYLYVVMDFGRLGGGVCWNRSCQTGRWPLRWSTSGHTPIQYSGEPVPSAPTFPHSLLHTKVNLPAIRLLHRQVVELQVTSL